MPYVERDGQNNIIVVYANEQVGIAEEYLAIDSQEWIAHQLGITKLAKQKISKQEMYRILSEGFQWRATNPDPWSTVSIDDEMQGFLTRTLLKLNEGRVSPHGGFIRSNGVTTIIDDIGMRELCLFAGMWGDAIAAVRIQTEDAVSDWDAFDPYAVDWSVNWTADDASNGWNDNSVTQAP